MRARWASFGVGLWLLLAPLTLGYTSVAAVLHDVTLGLLVCVATLAAMEWPLARFTLAGPGIWLLAVADTVDWGSSVVGRNQLVCGLAVLVLALVPGRKVSGARSPAKMAA
jgi:hypothetical protein